MHTKDNAGLVFAREENRGSLLDKKTTLQVEIILPMSSRGVRRDFFKIKEAE